MELLDSFNSTMFIPNISSLSSIDNVLASLGSFSENDRKHVEVALRNSGHADRVSVGVKKLIYIAEMSSQDEEKVEKFLNTVNEEGLSPQFN